MSHPSTPRAAISLERSVGVPERDTFRSERAETAASMQGDRPRLMWRATADSVTQWIKENSDADVKPEGAPCSLHPLHLHGCESTKWKQQKEKIHNLLLAPQQKLISMLNYSLRQMKDATINVYDWLGIEVWVIVSWGIEPDVCFRAVKTKHCLAIVMLFNYRSIVWLCREGHFCIDEGKKSRDSICEHKKEPAIWPFAWSTSAILSVLKLYKASHESRLSYSLLRYHICEYWCHHTSLISEIHHSPRLCNTLCACTLVIMPFVFSEAVIESEICRNECLADKLIVCSTQWVVHGSRQIELYLYLPQVTGMTWKWV